MSGTRKSSQAVRGGLANVYNQTPGIYLFERTWQPDPDIHNQDCLVIREEYVGIKSKWIYIFFHDGKFSNGIKPQLCAEIFANEKGEWTKASKPGEGKPDFHKYCNDGKFVVGNRAKLATYFFFLSPIQLGKKSVDRIPEQIAKEKYAPNPEIKNKDGDISCYWANSRKEEVVLVSTPVCMDEGSSGMRHFAMLVDPLAWELDIQELGCLPSLDSLHKHLSDKKMSAMRFVANMLDSYIKNGEPDNNITGHTKTGSDLIRMQDWPIPNPPDLSFTCHPAMWNRQDSPQVMHFPKIPDGKWRKNPSKEVNNVAALWLYLDDVSTKTLAAHGEGFVTELGEWIKSPRHSILDQDIGDVDRDTGDPLFDNFHFGVAHYAIITTRLLETKAGIEIMKYIFEPPKGGIELFPKKLFEFKSNGEEVEPAAKKWYERIEKTSNFIAKLFENATPHLVYREGSKDKAFRILVFVFQKCGAKRLQLDKVGIVRTMLDGTTKATRQYALVIKIGSMDEWKRRAEKFHHLGEKFEKVLGPIEKVFEVISVILSTYEFLQKIDKNKASAVDVLKMATLYADTAIKVAIRMEQVDIAGAEQLGLVAERGTLKALNCTGVMIGAIGSLVSWHVELNEAGNAALGGSTGVAVGHMVQATGAAVGFSATVAYMLLPSLAAGVSGPPGWIAIVGFGLAAAGTIICKACTRTAWEEFASNCFLGYKTEEYDVLPTILGGPYVDHITKNKMLQLFRLNPEFQAKAAAALLSRFKILAWMDGTTWIEPGICPRDACFLIQWEYQLSPPGEKPEKRVIASARCFPYDGLAHIEKLDYQGGCSSNDLKFEENCWLKSEPTIEEVNEGKPLKEFALFPGKTAGGPYPNRFIPFKVSVQLCLTNSVDPKSWLALFGKESAPYYDEWRFVPRQNPVTIEFKYVTGRSKEEDGAYFTTPSS